MGEETKTPEPALREVLDAAWDHVEKFEAGETPAPATPETPAAQPEVTDEERDREALAHPEHEGRDIRGRFAPKKEPGAPAPAAPREAQPEAVPPPPAPAAPTAFKPPQSWRPVERVALEKADPVVQQAVARREREIAQTLQQSAPHRKFVDEWSRTIQPFEQMIRASGQTPLAATANMFKVAQALATQPVPVRAQLIAGLMRSYGVGEHDLAAVLQGQPVAQPAYQQPMLDPRVDELYQELAAYRESQESAAAAAEDAALDEFAADHPWLDDLSDVMSDAMAVAAKRGIAMDYEEAYQRALMLRPDLMEIERQRAAESANAAPTPDPRQAAKSVHGNPRVRARTSDKPMTTREAAEAAWDAHASNGNRV